MSEELEKDYMSDIQRKLTEHNQKGDLVFPPENLIFNALNSTPLDQVIVALL